MRFTTVALLIMVISCTSRDDRGQMGYSLVPVTIPINLEKGETLVFTDVFEYPEFVALETNGNSLFSMVRQLIIADGLIFIVPEEPKNTIMLFKLDGSHIRTIKNFGRGPGEYISLHSAYVSESEDLIYSFDSGNKRYICMDYEGRIVKSFKASGIWGWGLAFNPQNGKLIIDLSFGGIDLLEEGKVLSPYLLAEYDTATYSRKPIFPAAGSGHYMSIYGLQIYSDTLQFLPPLWDTVYQFLQDTIIPRYIFEFGTFTKPQDLLTADDDLSFFKILKTGRFVCYHHNAMEDDDFVFTTHRTSTGEMILNRFDKKAATSNVYIYFRNTFIGHREDRRIRFQDLPVGLHENRVVFIHDPADILKNLEKVEETPQSDKAFSEYSTGFSRAFKNLKETDNPLIGLYPIKGRK